MKRNYEINELNENVAAKAANASECGNTRASQFVPIRCEAAKFSYPFWDFGTRDFGTAGLRQPIRTHPQRSCKIQFV